jgi:hypothetical protein
MGADADPLISLTLNQTTVMFGERMKQTHGWHQLQRNADIINDCL